MADWTYMMDTAWIRMLRTRKCYDFMIPDGMLHTPNARFFVYSLMNHDPVSSPWKLGELFDATELTSSSIAMLHLPTRHLVYTVHRGRCPVSTQFIDQHGRLGY